jgi:hypothetical protein
MMATVVLLSNYLLPGKHLHKNKVVLEQACLLPTLSCYLPVSNQVTVVSDCVNDYGMFSCIVRNNVKDQILVHISGTACDMTIQ